MTAIVPLEGKFLALTVVGKSATNVMTPFPTGATFNWSIDNPVIATISEITTGDSTSRKIAPNGSGLMGTVKVTCIVSFLNVYDEDTPMTLTNTFNVLIGDELPDELVFEPSVEDIV